ncbi:phage tail tape measure protein [Paenibacillus sp. CAA11]|uniref:phage tail tape measure protein n=1 Tax=Paenibacillus sp. CAA11 TaxID=1532905 RepID=UPI000D34F6B5|nr:phage tail tape measure protein [Paenibacillus sp. CAA11]AWB45272.1 phage tail tape measure protein [Paenibacillus sp. CAA11]
MTKIEAVDVGGIRAKITADISGYEAGVERAKAKTAELGVAGRQASAGLAQMAETRSKITQLTSVLDNVNSRIEVQRKKLAELKASYDTTFDAQKRSKLEAQIANTEGALLRLTATSDKTAKQIWALEDSLAKSGKSAQITSANFKQIGDSLRQLGASSSQIAAIEKSLKQANPEVLKRELAEVTAEMKRLGASSADIDKVTKELERNATSSRRVSNEVKALGVAYTGLAVAMGVAITKAVKTSADFEQSMANVKAISEATGDEFERLKNQALQLGATTAYTAAQSADAQALLAQAGFKTNEIIAAMPGVLSLAAAGQVDLATTADISSSILRGFGLQAEETSRVVDVLAKSSIDTNADVTDLGYAMKYVAPVAASMGISIEEATAAVGELSNAGIKGEMAGTQLRAILLALASPSKEAAFYMERLGVNIKDSSGNIVPLSNLIGQLTSVWGRLTQAQQADVAATLVGREAASGFITLIQNGQGTLDQYTESLKNAGGTAERVAGVQMDTLKGSITEMKSALEGVGITVGDTFAPAIRGAAEGITKLLSGFSQMNPEMRNAIVIFATITPLVAGAITAVVALRAAFATLQTTLAAAGVQMATFSASIPVIGAISLAVGALAAGISAIVAKNREAAEAVKKHDDAQKALNDTLNKSPLSRSVQELKELKAKHDELAKVLDQRTKFQERLNELEAQGSKGDNYGVVSEIDVLKEGIEGLDEKLRELGYDSAPEAQKKLAEMGKAAEQSVPALLEMKRAEIDDLAAKNDKISTMEGLVKRYRELSGAQNTSAAQQQELVSITDQLRKQYPDLNDKLGTATTMRAGEVDMVQKQIQADRNFYEQSAKSMRGYLTNLQKTTEAQRSEIMAQIQNYQQLINVMSTLAGAKAGASIIAPAGKNHKSTLKTDQGELFDLEQKLAANNQAEQAVKRALASLDAGYKGGGAKLPSIDLTPPSKTRKAKTGGAKAKKTKKSGKSAAELAEEARKKAYDADIATVRYQADMYDWSADKQIEAYEKVRGRHKKYLAESIEDQRTLNLQLKRLTEDSVKSRYELSTTWIDKDQRRMEEANKTDVEMAKAKVDAYTRLRSKYAKTSDQFKDADDKLYQARKELTSALVAESKRQYEASAEWIEKEERRMEDAGKSEQDIAAAKLAAWTRVRDRYKKESELYKKDSELYKSYSELYKKADEEVYRARKDLTQKSEKLAEDLVKTQKSSIEDAKKAELAAIEERKKAALADYDARIKAIDDLLAKEAELNTDADYETQLREKQARVDLLASAVGPEGIQEREDTIKEIERMRLEHDRDLRKRELESQKKAIQDEKSEQETAFENEKAAAEAQYTALAEAFDSYSGNIKSIEDGIAAFRVSSSATANAQILADLDNFLAQYNAKMAVVANASLSGRDADLAEYNSNKDAWDAAKASGNKAEMARLEVRNAEIRKQYGITKDTGKLQSFATGGIVQGASGSAVMVQAHAGEIVLNPQQQAALWGLLNGGATAAHSGLAPSAQPTQQITNHIDMSIGSVEAADPDTGRAIVDERARVAARIQAQGVKTR